VIALNSKGTAADAQALALMRECGLTVEVDEATLHALVSKLDDLVLAAESAVAILQESCGPSPSSLGGQVATVIRMGTGYHRTARDTIKALFKARNSARKKKGAKS